MYMAKEIGSKVIYMDDSDTQKTQGSHWCSTGEEIMINFDLEIDRKYPYCVPSDYCLDLMLVHLLAIFLLPSAKAI